MDIGSVYDNRIDLKVEDKIVASGELIIINDRYGVKINQIFTEEKNQASDNAEYAQEHPQQQQIEEMLDEPEYTQDELEAPPVQEDTDTSVNEEDFDYSDFDVDDEDL